MRSDMYSFYKPDVVVVVNPDDKWMSSRYDEPLPYVEFGIVNQQWPLDVLLQNFSVVVTASGVGIHDVIVVSKDDDS